MKVTVGMMFGWLLGMIVIMLLYKVIGTEYTMLHLVIHSLCYWVVADVVELWRRW